jgi:hypothetical protein
VVASTTEKKLQRLLASSQTLRFRRYLNNAWLLLFQDVEVSVANFFQFEEVVKREHTHRQAYPR